MVTGLRELFRNTESSKFVRTSKRKKREKNWTLNPKPYCPIVSKETLVIESDVWLMIIDLNLYHSKCLESAICKLQRQNFELWSCSWQNNQEPKEQNQIVASSSWSHNWSLNHPLNFEQTRLIISKPGSLNKLFKFSTGLLCCLSSWWMLPAKPPIGPSSPLSKHWALSISRLASLYVTHFLHLEKLVDHWRLQSLHSYPAGCCIASGDTTTSWQHYIPMWRKSSRSALRQSLYYLSQDVILVIFLRQYLHSIEFSFKHLRGVSSVPNKMIDFSMILFPGCVIIHSLSSGAPSWPNFDMAVHDSMRVTITVMLSNKNLACAC